VWTIGHSRHSIIEFQNLLRQYQIEVVVDVRTTPHSRLNPQFNSDFIKNELALNSIKYLYMGKELGGRPDDDSLYDSNGHVLYGELAKTSHFQSGIERILEGAQKFRVAVMCSEGKPDGCHRHLLIGRVLAEKNCDVLNILPDGGIIEYLELQPEESQFTLLGEEVKPWKSLLSVRQGFQQKNSLRF